jgi:hypothetical protein
MHLAKHRSSHLKPSGCLISDSVAPSFLFPFFPFLFWEFSFLFRLPVFMVGRMSSAGVRDVVLCRLPAGDA